jgi:CBS domain-containing protein
MSTDVAVVRDDTPFRRIVEVLARRRVTAVPVVDSAGHVMGVVSEADLLHKVEFVGAGHERHLFEGRRRRAARDKATGETAAELMSSPAITVSPEAPLAEAARLMDGERVKRLPVVDEAGRMVGIVSRGDLVRVYLRPDGEIRAAVIDEVLRETMWIDPGRIEVGVVGGVVTLTGGLDSRSTAQIVARLTAAVPGVVGVVDRLGYRYDDTVTAVSRSYRSHPFGENQAA